MPKFRGVYKDAKGAWYFKASTHKHPLTGKWAQVTLRGFATAAAAATAREDLLREAERQPKTTVSGLTVRALVERYLDDYVDPWIGSLRVRELTAEAVASWQHKLATEGSKKTGRGLSPNTIRLARAPLNGALKQAVAMGLLSATSPMRCYLDTSEGRAEAHPSLSSSRKPRASSLTSSKTGYGASDGRQFTVHR